MAQANGWNEAVGRAKANLAHLRKRIAETAIQEDTQERRHDIRTCAENLKGVMEPLVSLVPGGKRKEFHLEITNHVPKWGIVKDVRDASYHEGDIVKNASITVRENLTNGTTEVEAVHSVAAAPGEPELEFPGEFLSTADQLEKVIDKLATPYTGGSI